MEKAYREHIGELESVVEKAKMGGIEHNGFQADKFSSRS
jgi:hypothetical protein